MANDYMNYPRLMDRAMQSIVKEVLGEVASKGMKGEHHFFISFLTSTQGVVLSERLKNKYYGEMTIILQYQYEELMVSDDYFSVVLSFDGSKEKIIIPFNALTAFADPCVKFGIQFKQYFNESFQANDHMEEMRLLRKPRGTKEFKGLKKTKELIADNIVALDHFRKLTKPKKV